MSQDTSPSLQICQHVHKHYEQRSTKTRSVESQVVMAATFAGFLFALSEGSVTSYEPSMALPYFTGHQQTFESLLRKVFCEQASRR